MRKLIAALVVVAVWALSAGPVAAAVTPGAGGFVITVDARGTVARTGAATIRGTLTCDTLASGPASIGVSASLTQPVGRIHAVSGSGFTTVECTPLTDAVTWSITVLPWNGKFAVGTAFASVFTFGCDPDFITCDSGQKDTTVTLRR